MMSDNLQKDPKSHKVHRTVSFFISADSALWCHPQRTGEQLQSQIFPQEVVETKTGAQSE